jgi:hypothetical protein
MDRVVVWRDPLAPSAAEHGGDGIDAHGAVIDNTGEHRIAEEKVVAARVANARLKLKRLADKRFDLGSRAWHGDSRECHPFEREFGERIGAPAMEILRQTVEERGSEFS